MADGIWEDFISLNSRLEISDEHLGPVADFVGMDMGEVVWDQTRIPLATALARDSYALPTIAQREGYYGPNHFHYWASGLRDYCQLLDWMDRHEVSRDGLLDMGCATGRLIRHVGLDPSFSNVMGCDINRLHIEWIGRHLSGDVRAFQNSSLPTLPIPDASINVVTAFSVFTHIESFVSTWLMELRRVLRPGGIAWLTVHGDRTWRDVKPEWPLYNALDTHPDYAAVRDQKEMPSDRLVFRWLNDSSYSANVFYRYDYLRHHWGKFMEVVDIFPALPHYQDVVVLRK